MGAEDAAGHVDHAQCQMDELEAALEGERERAAKTMNGLASIKSDLSLAADDLGAASQFLEGMAAALRMTGKGEGCVNEVLLDVSNGQDLVERSVAYVEYLMAGVPDEDGDDDE